MDRSNLEYVTKDVLIVKLGLNDLIKGSFTNVFYVVNVTMDRKAKTL